MLKTTNKGKAIALLATGATQAEVGKEIGVCQRTVSTLARKYKAEIEQLTLDLIAKSIPLIKANHLNTLKLAKEILKAKDSKQMQDIMCKLAMLGVETKDILQLSDKKEERALNIT